MLGEAQGEREDGSARGLLAPLAAANKGKKCRGRGPPGLHPTALPTFHSLDPLGPSGRDGGSRAAAPRGASLLRRGREPGVLPAPWNPGCTPKGHKVFLHPPRIEEQLKPDRAMAEPWSEEQRGLTLPGGTASLKGS